MSGRPIVPVDEVACRLEADARALHTFHCTPERYVDLATGWLIGCGLMEPDKAPASRLSMQWGENGPVVYVDSIAGGWSDHDIERPQDAAPAHAKRRDVPPADLPEAFRAMYARARRYHETGGIHAAAIVSPEGMVGFAEDVGRHNAVDKAIGEAARAGHALERCGLVTSARVSGEMAKKAAYAGLAWIASRSVPTTLAITLAGRAGVTIVARAASPDARVFDPRQRPLGVVMAGGRNTRFGGAPKALETVGGRRIVDRAIDALRPMSADVVMIANEPATYESVPLEKRPDSRAGAGPVGGLREALLWARERGMPGVLVVACDMPFVPTTLLDALWRASDGCDGAVAESDGPRGVEPLCAAYRTSCLGPIDRAIERDDLRVVGFFDDADIRRLTPDDVAGHGDPALAFFNVNTPAELEWARALVESDR